MTNVLRSRRLLLALAASTLIAAGSGTVSFVADRPGVPLAGIDGAEEVVQVLQGNGSLLWSALSGNVVSSRVQGWPIEIDGNELGGGLVIEIPEDGSAGAIDFGEAPRSLSFEVDG